MRSIVIGGVRVPTGSPHARLGRLSFVLALALGACVDTGQARVALPLYLAGSALDSPLMAAGEISLSVERAELAFGPLYLCAGNTAGELCDTARLEWLGSQVVDLTRAEPERAGELTGVSGSVRSFMYDLGISSQLTREAPYVLDAARQLGGASFRLSGSAELQGAQVEVSAEVPIEQTPGTEPGVPVIRKSSSERFSHTVEEDEAGLLVRFDAERWLSSIDLRPYLQDASCAPGMATVCAQQFEQSCASDGSVSSTRDCSAIGQACIAGVGCSSELRFADDSEAYRALRNALLVGARPEYEWGFQP
jgi:hypothetical protein